MNTGLQAVADAQDRLEDTQPARRRHLPDGRVGRIREVSGREYRVRVRRPTGTTHQFMMFAAKDLERVGCSKGWMSPEGYARYLAATLARMRLRQARSGKPG